MTAVLVIEDDSALAAFLTEALEDKGYTVYTAGHGQEGIAQLELRRIDLIVSDIMMPIMDGIALCRWLQESPRYRDIPRILISAIVEPLVGSDCTYAAFISKPIDLERFYRVIEATLLPY